MHRFSVRFAWTAQDPAVLGPTTQMQPSQTFGAGRPPGGHGGAHRPARKYRRARMEVETMSTFRSTALVSAVSLAATVGLVPLPAGATADFDLLRLSGADRYGTAAD